MNRLLTLAPRYAPPIADGDSATLLLAGQEYDVVEGAPLTAIIRRASNAIASRRELVAAASEAGASPGEAEHLVHELLDDQVLVETDADVTPEEREIAAHLHRPPALVARRLRGLTVRIVVSGALADAASAFEAAVRELGFLATAYGDGPAIVLAPGWNDPTLLAFEREALDSGKGWLPVIASGAEGCVGPYVTPGVTAGPSCLAAWARENDAIGGFLTVSGAGPDNRWGVGAGPLIPLLARVSVRGLLTGLIDEPEGGVAEAGAVGKRYVLAFTPGSLVPDVHEARPFSAATRLAVDPPSPVHPDPPVLEPLPCDDRYRTMGADEAYEQHVHLLSPYAGFITSIDQLPAPPGAPLYTFVARHPVDRHARTLAGVGHNAGHLSSGKGATVEAARAGAIFEPVERYSSAWEGSEFRIRAPYEEAARWGAFDPHTLFGFSQTQYAERESNGGLQDHPSLHVPAPLDPRRPIDWVPFWSLLKEEWRYVPAAYAYLCYPDDGEPFCFGDSNGNAAGVTREEAIIQGFFELAERDGVALWWYNRLLRPGVDLASFGRPYLLEMVAQYDRHLGRSLHVLDVTTDLGVPTFVAIALKADGADPVLGFGAHFDAGTAVERAVTELTQALHASGEIQGAVPPGERRSPWPASAGPYLLPDPAVPLRTASDYDAAPRGTLLDVVGACVDCAGRIGLELCVLDLTREHVGVPAVKVVVPGLASWWRRLGAGRLYEGPVSSGWTATRVREVDLNPWSITV